MAVLTSTARKRMPSSSFALPGKGKGPSGKGAGAYPINDAEHGRKALQLGAKSVKKGNLSPASYARIKAKVKAKFPGIKQGGATAPLRSALRAKA